MFKLEPLIPLHASVIPRIQLSNSATYSETLLVLCPAFEPAFVANPRSVTVCVADDSGFHDKDENVHSKACHRFDLNSAEYKRAVTFQNVS